MSKKYDATIYFTLKGEDKDNFYKVCDENFTTPSLMLRKWISLYIKHNGDVKWD